jgi:hypothetical protein
MRGEDTEQGTHFRSGDRVFCQNGKWFFQTREDDHGPFSTREAAEADLQRYVDEMSFFDEAAASESSEQGPSDSPTFANFTLVDKD